MQSPPKRRVITVGGGRSVSETFSKDVSGFGKLDIQKMLVSITVQDTRVEVANDNPPMVTEVDGSKSKPVSQAERKVIVLFGTTIDVSTLHKLKDLLVANIAASTWPISGALKSPGSWEFRLISHGQTVPLPGRNFTMGQNDYVVLMPRLSYASSVNMRVAHGKSAMTYRPTKSKKTAKRNQNLGFMAMTARQARQAPGLLTFSVTVGNTKRFAVSGEKRKYGSAFLKIRPRLRKGFRR